MQKSPSSLPRPLNRKATIRDVAELAGVSRATVTRALEVNRDSSIKPETRALVLEAAEKLRYRPSPSARSLKSRRPMAACIPFVRLAGARTGAGQLSLSLGDIMNAALSVFQPVGYRLEPSFFPDDETAVESLISMAHAGYFDAAVIPYPRATMIEAYRRMADLGVITVMRRFPAVSHPNICHFDLPNNRMTPVVDELVRQGRRRILFTRAVTEEITEWVGRNPEVEIACAAFAYGRGQVRDLMPEYLDSNAELIAWADAIVCWDEFVGWEFFRALTARGVRVPEDKLVTGAADFRHIFKPLPIQLLNYAPGAMDVGILCRKLLTVLQDRNMLSRNFQVPPPLRRPDVSVQVLPTDEFKQFAEAELRREELLDEVERYIISEES